MHVHNEYHQKVMQIMSKIAKEKSKSIGRIERLIFVERNNAITRRFWQLFDAQFPNTDHPQFLGRCPECGNFELIKEGEPNDALLEILEPSISFEPHPLTIHHEKWQA